MEAATVDQRRQRRAALLLRIAAARTRHRAASAAFTDDLLSARARAQRNAALREKLNGIKDQLRKLEAQLAESLSIQASKSAKYDLINESISNTAARNEQLTKLLTDQRTRRDEYVNVISHQLEVPLKLLKLTVLQKTKKPLRKLSCGTINSLVFKLLEEKVTESLSNMVNFSIDAINLTISILQGVRFMFNKIDMKNPDKEYSFCIKIANDRYSLLQCVPPLEDSKELLKDLNRTNDLFKFVRIMRERFQATILDGFIPNSSFCSEVSSITASSPPASVDSESENATNQSNSNIRAKKQNFSEKKEPPHQSAISPRTIRC
ncbi:hypothetical protein ACP4OV_020029 [Aristida adscensionis]